MWSADVVLTTCECKLVCLVCADSFDRPLDSVEVLDTITGIWSTATPLSFARHDHICTVVGGLLYVIGGRDANYL